MHPEPVPTRKSWSRGRRLFLLVVGIALLALMIRLLPVVMVVFVAQPVRVEGQAMRPSLNHGDRVFFSKMVRDLKRGEIVIFRFPLDPSKSYVKRIIGLPGETVEIQDGRVLIDGTRLEEPYLDQQFVSHDATIPVKVPEQHYFVLGDNRRNSSDSRYWGTVPRELIYGQYLWRYWP